MKFREKGGITKPSGSVQDSRSRAWPLRERITFGISWGLNESWGGLMFTIKTIYQVSTVWPSKLKYTCFASFSLVQMFECSEVVSSFQLETGGDNMDIALSF